jgi:chlorobactene glucosyltransferase
MMLYQILILCSLLIFLGILVRNMFDLPDLPFREELRAPMVSILVPARNEEEHIGPCVASLLRQHYRNMEIIVLDDNSTDGTWDELQRLALGAGSKLLILKGKALPDGWHGKAWACHQLSEKAVGELLLFTDADTRHHPDALRRAVAALEEREADLLSLTPSQELVSFWEKLIVPLVYHILLCYLPLRMVSNSRSPAFCYAIGQFMLFKGDSYRKMGGHRSVRSNLVEDVSLCKKMKQSGGRVVAFNGSDAVSCRMYRDFSGIWQGFSKNLFAGLGYNTVGLFALMTMVVLFYLAPFVFMTASVMNGDYSAAGFWLPTAQIATAILSRSIIAIKFRQPLFFAFLHALSQTVLLGIAFNSFRLVKFGPGPSWKERNYRFTGKDHSAG